MSVAPAVWIAGATISSCSEVGNHECRTTHRAVQCRRFASTGMVHPRRLGRTAPIARTMSIGATHCRRTPLLIRIPLIRVEHTHANIVLEIKWLLMVSSHSCHPPLDPSPHAPSPPSFRYLPTPSPPSTRGRSPSHSRTLALSLPCPIGPRTLDPSTALPPPANALHRPRQDLLASPPHPHTPRPPHPMPPSHCMGPSTPRPSAPQPLALWPSPPSARFPLIVPHRPLAPAYSRRLTLVLARPLTPCPPRAASAPQLLAHSSPRTRALAP